MIGIRTDRKGKRQTAPPVDAVLLRKGTVSIISA
jgi:hypothetical protein